MATTTEISELASTTHRYHDGVDMVRQFRVQRPGGSPHRVEISISLDGTPQHERCDCKAYQYRHQCSHITAVYNSGALVPYVD